MKKETFKEIAELMIKNEMGDDKRFKDFSLHFVQKVSGEIFENLLTLRYKGEYVYTLDNTQLTHLYFICVMFLRGIDYAMLK